MHGRVVGAAITLVVLLAVPTVAAAATKTVQAGPPGSQTAQFQEAVGDANNYFRNAQQTEASRNDGKSARSLSVPMAFASASSKFLR